MPGIRGVHQLVVGDALDDLIDMSRTLRDQPGCVEAEVYAANDRAVVTELWEDQASHGAYWSGAASADDPLLHGLSASDATSEFYRHQYYIPGATWTPAEHPDSGHTITWPAAGAVRVLIQGSAEDVDVVMAAAAADTEETHREPGCVAFDCYPSAEFSKHFLLLELWRDQITYDAHWLLRIKTGAGGGDAPDPPARDHGTNGFEFYRHEPFVRLYDRWLPSDVGRRSETIIWPA